MAAVNEITVAGSAWVANYTGWLDSNGHGHSVVAGLGYTIPQDVPSGTNIVVAAFTVDDLANLAVILAAMKAVSGVGTGKVVASGQVPSKAPEGVHGEGRWELTVDAGLRGYTGRPEE